MISKISQFFPRPSLKFAGNLITNTPFRFSATKKIRDSDELSIEQMEEVLGRPLKESEKPKQKSPRGLKQDATMRSVKEPGGLIQKQQGEKVLDESVHFYGLMPLRNEGYPLCLDPNEPVIQQTPNQNIFKALDLPEDCSFDNYTSALSKFRTETELYGDEQPRSVIESKSLEFKVLLNPESPYLDRLRNRLMVNISIPGTIECEDSRKFMDLRPVEEFRHTPIVPISDSYMQKHKEMLERYHRKQFVFEVKKESVINWMLTVGACSIAGYLIFLVLKKEQERSVQYSRLKYQRIMGQSEQKPIFRI